MDIDRAKAISEVAQTVINSAKVEIQFLEATDQVISGDFFDVPRLTGGIDPGDPRLGRSLLPRRAS